MVTLLDIFDMALARVFGMKKARTLDAGFKKIKSF